MISDLGSGILTAKGWNRWRRSQLVRFLMDRLPADELPKNLHDMRKDAELIPLMDGLTLQGKLPDPDSLVPKVLDPQVKALQDQIDALTKRLSEVSEPKRGPGRPRLADD